MNQHSLTTEFQLAIRVAVAACVSLALAQLLHLQHPLYAMIAAIIVTDLNPSQSRQLGLRRLVATAVGALWGATLIQLLPSSTWTMALGVLVAVLSCYFLKASGAAKIAAFICGIVVLDHDNAPWSYALFRFIETALGIVVAWAISYVPKIIRVDDTEGTGLG